MLSLWQAVLIDVGSLLIVVGNGSSLLWSRAFRDSDIPEIAPKIEIATTSEREYQPPQFFLFNQQNSSPKPSQQYNPLIYHA